MSRGKKIFDKALLSLSDSSGRLNLFGLAVPLFFQQVFTILLGTVNTVVLTKVSEDAVTAVNVANMVISVPINLTNMVTSGSLILLSLFLGAGKKSEVGRIYTTAIAAAAALSAVLSVSLSIFAEPLLGIMNISGNILSSAVVYFRIRIICLFFTVAANCITAVLRAHGYAKSTMISGMITNAVNALLSLLVISPYYKGNKISGVAFAAAIGQLCGMLYAVAALYLRKDINYRGRFSFAILRRIIGVGIPSGMSLFAFSISSAVSTSIIAALGQAAVNVKVYALNISQYTYLFGYAVAQSNSLMIGRCVGAGDYSRAKRQFAQAARLVPVLNAALAALVFIFSNKLIRIFTVDQGLIATAHIIFLIDIAIEAARGNTHIGENALCSVTDTAFTSAVSVSACVFNSFACWLLCIKLGLGIYGFYAASLIDEGTRGILYRIRWSKGNWIYLSKNKVQ